MGFTPRPDITAADDRLPRKRRWIPMSVWMSVAMLAALLLVDVFSVGLPAYRRHSAARRISESAGSMSRRPGPLKSLARFAPHGYESLFDDVVELWLGDSEISDAVLDDVGRLTNLEMLSLRDTKITNSQMVYLKGLTRLKWLSLSRTRITAEGLKHLIGLRNLEFVA